jgi:hypothetical protein
MFTQKQRIKNGERRELLDGASRKETAPSGVVVVGTGKLSKAFARAHHLSHLTPSLEKAGDARQTNDTPEEEPTHQGRRQGRSTMGAFFSPVCRGKGWRWLMR